MGITWRFQQRQNGGQLHFVLIEFTFQVIRMILDFSASLESQITTRKPEKTNRITDRLNSVSKSVGIYRPYLRRTIFSDDFTNGMIERFKLR